LHLSFIYSFSCIVSLPCLLTISTCIAMKGHTTKRYVAQSQGP
jgi:hypothetical protein